MNKKYQLKRIFFLILILILQIIIYLPHVGSGFVTDDFVWLGNSVIDGRVDYLRPFTITTGFFRPLVSWTFGLQYQLHGMSPRPYGWFNLFLHLVNILLVYLLLSSVEISRPYALWAAALFSLNAKGPPMAVGWISGRTTLLYAFFALLSLYLFLKAYRQDGWTCKRIILYSLVGITYFAALLSKESAAAVPVFVVLFIFLDSLAGRMKINNNSCNRFFLRSFLNSFRKAFMNSLVFIIPLIVYFYLREGSNAIVPLNAPEYYRLTLAPLLILRNLLEYITRAGILEIIIIIYLLLILLINRSKIKPEGHSQNAVIIVGIVWFLCFLLPTLLIPARSDIYVYFPQLGLHLAALPIIFYLWERSVLKIRKRRNQVITILPLGLFILAYMGVNAVTASTNGRKGHSSTLFIKQLLHHTSKLKSGDHVFLIDLQPGQAFSPSRTVSYGFSALLHLYNPQKHLTGEIAHTGSVADIKCDKNTLQFFFWGEGRLTEPLYCWQLKHLAYLLYPHQAMLAEVVKKLKKPITTRRYRLRKRKKNLNRLGKLKKNT